jgi:hypothetical protein
MLGLIYKTLLVVIGVLFASIADKYNSNLRQNLILQLKDKGYQDYEALYLPEENFVSFLSLGYRNVAAKILWFTTLNYFGKHHKGDRNYKWLVHRCSLMTNLDPKSITYYDFCSALISWEVGKPKVSIKLLTKAIQNYPKYWRFWYLRGFTHLYFLKNEKAALKDLVYASRLPGVHPVVAKLASKRYGEIHGTDATIELLKDLISTSYDENLKKSLKERLLKVIKEKKAQT